jgi:hypothetical protein
MNHQTYDAYRHPVLLRSGMFFVLAMIRAYLYLAASGVIWLVEGFLFSRFLAFVWWQTAILTLIYIGLFGLASAYLLRALRGGRETSEELALWRAVSLAPMFVVIVGSFVSLPLILIVAALGKL